MEEKQKEKVCELTVFSQSINTRVDKLKEIYALDRRKAKIIFDNDKSNYSTTSICLFEYPNGDFRIACLIRNYGVSVSAVLYSREKTNWVISYKHKTKSFYYIDSFRRLKQLTLNLLDLYCSNFFITEYFLKRFAWTRNLRESKFGHSLSFTNIVRNKLYNEKELLKHLFGCPYPVAKILSENNGPYTSWDFLKVWKEQKKVLININNLKPEFINSPYFFDTTRMAASIGKKVNCSWGLKRLKLEHDNFSKEIVKVILEFEELKDLNISEVYKDFAKFSDLEILLTNHDLISEGKTMHHCVGTYSSLVDNGKCAIYKYKGHTLDLRYIKPRKKIDEDQKKFLEVNQLMGFNNTPAPIELLEELQLIVDKFNSNIKEYVFDFDFNDENDLPF